SAPVPRRDSRPLLSGAAAVRDRGASRRSHPVSWWLAIVAVGLVTTSLVATALTAPAGATLGGDEPPPVPTTLRELPEDAGRIIKHPNYGHEPIHPGDRGGWQQTLILLGVLGGIGAMVLLVRRD